MDFLILVSGFTFFLCFGRFFLLALFVNCALSQAKDKEERLLKRQKNREQMEEQHKQKSVRTEEQGISVSVIPKCH